MILSSIGMQHLCMISIMETCQKYFILFFTSVKEKHNHNTRFASRLTYSIPKIRTNYGKFNIRFSGVKVWNEIDDEIKKLKPSKFKAEVKKFLLQKYKE